MGAPLEGILRPGARALRARARDRHGEARRRALARGDAAPTDRRCTWLHEDFAIARCLRARVQRLLGDAPAAAASLEQARAALGRVCGDRTRTAFQLELECGLAALAEQDYSRAADQARAAVDAL